MVKENVVLTITSLLSVILFTIHFTGDTIRGMSGGGLENLFGILILVVFLYATLILAERRSGYVIVLLGSLFALAMPVIHMRGAGVGGKFAESSGAFLFIWTLWALVRREARQVRTGTWSATALAAWAIRSATHCGWET